MSNGDVLHQKLLESDQQLLEVLKKTEEAVERAIAERVKAMEQHREMIKRVQEQLEDTEGE